jgi:hypothetical protein
MRFYFSCWPLAVSCCGMEISLGILDPGALWNGSECSCTADNESRKSCDAKGKSHQRAKLTCRTPAA